MENNMQEKIEEIIELEEMDWRNAKTSAIQQIREALLSLEINYDILKKAQLRLDQIVDCLPKEEKERRERLKSDDIVVGRSMGKSKPINSDTIK
ncbi:hypothetical protein KAR91_46795 [Candidatus Pacearchaeota archaeon]|nr:hypothetical protein [Candidatus Pacearchaeota archaeon]